MKKTVKFLLALAVALVPMLTAVPAFADEYENGNGNGNGGPTEVATRPGTAEEPAEAGITKLLQMPVGTTVPETASFRFSVIYRATLTGGGNTPQPITIPGNVADETGLFDLTIGDTPLSPAGNAHFGPFETDIDVYVATTDNILENVNWTAPGQFLFTIREIANTNTTNMPFLPGYVENMFYDDAFYTLFVRVAVCPTGEDAVAGCDDFFVEYTAAWEGTGPFEQCEYDENDVEVCEIVVPEGEQLGKGEPDPNRPGGPGNLVGYSDVFFLNTFIRRTETNNPPVCPDEDPDCELGGGDLPPTPPPVQPTCPEEEPECDEDELPPFIPGEPGTPGEPPVVPGFDNAFTISKNIITDSHTSINSTFDFNAVITLPSLAQNAPIAAWIYTFNAATGVFDREDYVIEFTVVDGVGTTNFELGHNQALAFAALPIGTQIFAEEELPAGYTPSVQLFLGGDRIGAYTGNTGATISTDDIAGAPHRLGEGLNLASFVNRNITPPITGLLLNNMPIIMVVVAGAGFFAMTVANKKRRAYE